MRARRTAWRRPSRGGSARSCWPSSRPECRAPATRRGGTTRRKELAMDRDVSVEARESEAGYGPLSDGAGPGPGTSVGTGHHRFVQGDFDILVLSDGFIAVPGDVVLPDVSAAQRASLLGRLDTVDGAVRSKANIPVLRRGVEVILVDIGSGPKYQPTDGRLGA